MHHDYRELKRRLDAAGVLERRPRAYGGTLLSTGALFGLGLLLLARFRDPWVLALAALILSVTTVQLAFLVHDAGHRQIFARRAPSTLLGLLLERRSSNRSAPTGSSMLAYRTTTHCGVGDYLTGALGNLLLGVSYGWWIDKHTRHHAHPNHVDLDPDIDLPLIAFSPEQAAAKRGLARAIAKYQAWCAVPLLTLVAYGQHLSSVGYVLTVRSRYRRWEAAALLGHLALYVGAPVALLGPWSALLLIVIHQASVGLYLGLVFAPNHKGMALADDRAPLDALRAQVLTARNVRGHPLVDWWYGGLNYQIEHHLFPALPRHRLRAARPIVRDFCRERGIPYHETSMLGSYREILSALHALGAPLRARVPSDRPRQPAR